MIPRSRREGLPRDPVRTEGTPRREGRRTGIRRLADLLLPRGDAELRCEGARQESLFPLSIPPARKAPSDSPGWVFVDRSRASGAPVGALRRAGAAPCRRRIGVRPG